MPRAYDRNGNRVRSRHRTTVTDLTIAPRHDTVLPDNIAYSVVVVPANDGMPMIALVNPVLLGAAQLGADATRDAALAAEVSRIDTLQGNMGVVQANTTALLAQLAARKAIVQLPDVTVSQTASLALLVGERTYSVACAGVVKATDTILLQAKSAYPAGYGLRGYTVPSDNNLSIVLQCPALILGGSFSIPFSVFAIR